MHIHTQYHAHKQIKHQNKEPNKHGGSLDWRHAFYLATHGGAKALGIDQDVGTFELGKDFDAVVFDANAGMCAFFCVCMLCA